VGGGGDGEGGGAEGGCWVVGVVGGFRATGCFAGGGFDVGLEVIKNIIYSR